MKSYIDKFLYIKLCWNTIVGYLSIPITILDKALLIGVFLKVFGITQYKIVICVGMVFVVVLIYIGHKLLQGGIVERDISIGNRFNPELQEIYRKAGGKSLEIGIKRPAIIIKEPIDFFKNDSTD